MVEKRQPFGKIDAFTITKCLDKKIIHEIVITHGTLYALEEVALYKL
jgi:hypothetical protein